MGDVLVIVEFADSSNAHMQDARSKSVNFGSGKSPDSSNRFAQIDRVGAGNVVF